MSDLDAIRERHVEATTAPHPLLTGVCASCTQPWPCDAVRLLEEVEALQRSNTFLADPEFRAAMVSKEEELAMYEQRIAELEGERRLLWAAIKSSMDLSNAIRIDMFSDSDESAGDLGAAWAEHEAALAALDGKEQT